MIGPAQKGRGLPFPDEVAGVTHWIEWEVDVGDWRREHVHL